MASNQNPDRLGASQCVARPGCMRPDRGVSMPMQALAREISCQNTCLSPPVSYQGLSVSYVTTWAFDLEPHPENACVTVMA